MRGTLLLLLCFLESVRIVSTRIRGGYIASSLPLPLPEVNYTYRSPEDFKFCNTSHKSAFNNYDVEIDTHLLQKALPVNLTTLNTRGVSTLMNKLRCHEDIHVLVLGGSFTKGAGVFRGAARTAFSWTGRLRAWLKAAFPHSKINLNNAAQGSTTSFHAIHTLRQWHTPVDLIIMEYSLNDEGQSSREQRKLAHITEAIIRHVHQEHNQTALVYFSLNIFRSSAEIVHQEVCDIYGVPLVSYRRAVVEEFIACKRRNPSLPYLHAEKYCVPNFRARKNAPRYVFKLWDGLIHPVEETHRLVAQTMAYYLTQLVVLFNSSSSLSVPELHMPFPEHPIYMMHEHHMNSEQMEGGCSNPMTSFSSLNSDEETNAALLQAAFKPRKVSGWSFRQDKPGKPFGWITDPTPMNDSLSTKAPSHMSFAVLLVNGSVSITYLSTYENSGVFEVYMGVKSGDFKANGGIQSKSELPEGSLYCCNKSHPIQYPNEQREGVSTSKYIDTLRPEGASRVSEVKVVTVNTGYVGGYFLLNVEHIRLGDEELARRGGDKVKILGISSC